MYLQQHIYASPVTYSSAAGAATVSFPLVMTTTLTPGYCLIQDAESIGRGIVVTDCSDLSNKSFEAHSNICSYAKVAKSFQKDFKVNIQDSVGHLLHNNK